MTEYAPPYNGTPIAISKGLNAPNSLALDGRGNLFVANLNSTPNSVVEYTPPFTEQSAPVATITNGVNEQGTIGLNGASNLFVPNQGANTVTEYVPPYSNAPTTIVGGQSQPVALAIDAQRQSLRRELRKQHRDGLRAALRRRLVDDALERDQRSGRAGALAGNCRRRCSFTVERS